MTTTYLEALKGQSRAKPYLEAWSSGGLTRPLLFFGPEGTGKRFAALLACKTLLCQTQQGSSCRCFACQTLQGWSHPDVTYLAPPEEGKDLGVDAIREGLSKANEYPTAGPLRVILIEGVDTLTEAAGNALLKEVEEPPSTTRYLLLATSRTRVLPTLRSRTTQVPFVLLGQNEVESLLSKVESDLSKVQTYARLSQGSPGMALALWRNSKIKLRDRLLEGLDACFTGRFDLVFEVLGSLVFPQDENLLVSLCQDLLMAAQETQGTLTHEDARTKIQTLCRRKPALWLTLDKAVREGLATPLGNRDFHLKSAVLQAFVT